jgi:hypothetical protein
VTAVHKAPGDYPGGKEGDVLTVEFTVLGVPCLGLNGGPAFRHSEAFSFQIATDNQEETHHRRPLRGFIDMHAHLMFPRCSPLADGSRFDHAVSERSTLLDFGITTVRSPATPAIDGLRLRDDLSAGRILRPSVLECLCGIGSAI